MLKKYKNQIYEQIIADGFLVQDFEYTTENNTEKFCVKDSNLWFAFHSQKESYDIFRFSFTIFAPTVQISQNSVNASFDKVLLSFSNWLKRQVSQFVKERDDVDLFESFKANENFNFTDFNEEIHEVFSIDEVQLIKGKLLELNNHIKETYNATSIQGARIEAALMYLAEAAENKTKFDWRGTLISTFLSIMTTLTLDTNSGASLWNYIVNLFSSIKLLSK
jgi:hypothetical protein